MTLCFSARSTVSSSVYFVNSRSNRRLSCRIRDAGASVSLRGLGSKFTFLEGRARVAGAIGRRTARPRSKARRQPNHMHFGHPSRRNLWPKAGDHLAGPKPIATPIGAQLGRGVVSPVCAQILHIVFYHFVALKDKISEAQIHSLGSFEMFGPIRVFGPIRSHDLQVSEWNRARSQIEPEMNGGKRARQTSRKLNMLYRKS